MAGIVGIVDRYRDRDALASLVKQMCASITHQEWYQTSFYVDDSDTERPRAGLGRVSLGLLNSAPQPIWNRDRSICIVMDGELYNSEDLAAEERTRSTCDGRCGHQLRSPGTADGAPVEATRPDGTTDDTALILQSYERLGSDAFARLNGSFAIAIWDIPRQTLTLVSDRTGSRPIYYAYPRSASAGTDQMPPRMNQPAGSEGVPVLLFASEAKALLQERSVRWEIDHRAIADLLTFQMILGSKTLFQGIEVLPPATVLTYQAGAEARGTVSLKQYWEVSFTGAGQRLSDAEYVDGLAHYVRQAVERQMAGDLTVGLYLSGGLDSRVLLGAIDARHFPLPTFTQGIPGAHDVRFAKQMAQRAGSRHYYVPLRSDFFTRCAKEGIWLTDGMCSLDHMNRLNILAFSRQYCQIALDGLAGGTIPGGTHVYAVHLAEELREQDGSVNTDKLTRQLYSEFTAAFDDRALGTLLLPDYLRQLQGTAYESMRQEVSSAPQAHPANMVERVYLRNRQRRFSLFGPTMTRSQLECRTPFCDNDLLDFSFGIPPEARMGKRLLRQLLEREFPALAAVPWAFSGIPVSKTTPSRMLAQRALFKIQRELRDAAFRLSAGRLVLPYKRDYQDTAYWLRTALRRWTEDILLSKRATERGYFSPATIRQLLDEHQKVKHNHTRRLCTLISIELWHRRFVD